MKTPPTIPILIEMTLADKDAVLAAAVHFAATEWTMEQSVPGLVMITRSRDEKYNITAPEVVGDAFGDGIKQALVDWVRLQGVGGVLARLKAGLLAHWVFDVQRPGIEIKVYERDQQIADAITAESMGPILSACVAAVGIRTSQVKELTYTYKRKYVFGR